MTSPEKTNSDIEKILVSIQGEHMRAVNTAVLDVSVRTLKKAWDAGFEEAEHKFGVGRYKGKL